MGKVERMGSGIERMRELMRDTGLKEPVFEMDASFGSLFTVIRVIPLKQKNFRRE